MGSDPCGSVLPFYMVLTRKSAIGKRLPTLFYYIKKEGALSSAAQDNGNAFLRKFRYGVTRKKKVLVGSGASCEDLSAKLTKKENFLE